MQNIALPLELFIGEGLLQMQQQLGRFSVDHVEFMHGKDSNSGLLDIRIHLPKIRRQAEEGAAQSAALTVPILGRHAQPGGNIARQEAGMDTAWISQGAAFPLAPRRSQSSSPWNCRGCN